MEIAKPDEETPEPLRAASRRRPENPYPGLRAFEDHEARIFFGRDRHIDEILERLATSHFVPVIGPSGCGKSSLIRAGVVPALRAGRFYDAGSRWRIAVMRPENSPIWNLATVLYEMTRQDDEAQDYERIRQIASMLLADPDGIEEFRQQSGLAADTNILLVVDQFEELFNVDSAAQQDATDVFISIILNIHEAKFERVHAIITMRTDNLGDCARYTGLADAINRTLYLTPNLTPEELREAVELPAIRFGGSFEDGLVDRILDDMVGEIDQLPLMQHIMRRMWTTLAAAKSGPLELTHELYESFGCIADTVNHHAAELMAGLDDRQRALVPVLFRQLTERRLGGAHQDVRHPAQFKDLAMIAGLKGERGRSLLRSVIDHFRAPGALFLRPQVREHATLEPETRIDIVHECLIRKWDDLKRWVELEAKSVQDLRDLDAQAARARERGGGGDDPSGPDDSVKQESWMPAWLSGLAAFGGRYLDKESTEDLLRWRRREKPNAAWASRYGVSKPRFEQAMQFLDLSRTRHRRKKAVLSALVAATVMALIVGPAVWFAQSKQAQRDAMSRAANKLRLTAQIMSPDMPVSALELWRDELHSRELEDIARSYPQVRSWIASQRALEREHLNLLIVPDGGVDFQGAFSPLELPMAGRPAGTTEIVAIDVSPDATTWAVLSLQGVHLVDRTGKKVPGRDWRFSDGGEDIKLAPGRRHTISFHSSGKYIHAITDLRTLRRIGLEGGGLSVVRQLEGNVVHTAFSPDGGRLAVVRNISDASEAGDYEVEILDLLRDTRVSAFRTGEPLGDLTAVSFDADRPVMALAFDDTHLTLWNIPEGGTHVLDPAVEFRLPVAGVSRIVLSPDGGWLMGVSGVIGHLWRLSDVEKVRVGTGSLRPVINPTWSLYGHSLPIKLVRFLGDGSLLTMRENGDTRIWRYERTLFSRRLIAQPQQPQFETVSPGGLYSVIDRNGAFLHRSLRQASDSRVDVWELDTFATKAAISRDGGVVAVGYENGSVGLLAPKTERETRVGYTVLPLDGPEASPPREGSANRVASIAVSNDGGVVVALRADGSVLTAERLGNGRYVAAAATLEDIETAAAIALSPDGRQLAALSAGRLAFFVRQDGGWARRAEEADGFTASNVCSMAYSPDGRYFGAGTIDGTIHVARVSQGRVGALGSAVRSFPDSSVTALTFGRAGASPSLVSVLFERNAPRQPCRADRRRQPRVAGTDDGRRGVKIDVSLLDGTPVPKKRRSAPLRSDELLYRDAAFLPGTSTMIVTDVDFLGRSTIRFFDLVPSRVARLDIDNTARGEIAVEKFLDPANYFVDQHSGTGLPDWFPAQLGCEDGCWMIARTGLRNRLLVFRFNEIGPEGDKK